MPNTTAVNVTITLNTAASPAAPYNVSGIAGTVFYDNNGSLSFNTWSAENIGIPQPNGAAFQVNVVDSGYSSSNQTGIGNWAVTFIPRSPTTQQSPFGNNQNTISGSGVSGANGTWTLNLGSVKIKNPGSWDWSLMVQMTMPGGGIHCFASDPEMDVT